MNDATLKEQAKPWLEFLEELQNLGIEEKLPIPQICVFGDQSSGKSSLLESISGIPFPKGTGLVTKCPTRITMSTCEAGKPWSAELHYPKSIKAEANFDFVRKAATPEELSEYLREAAQLVTESSLIGFSNEPIAVMVESPLTPNLSVIDLPGIIRTTTAGQDRSVIGYVDDLLNDFMRQPETVIVAIIPANQDIATIDILERAHMFDPEGVRTIGVLTKPDLVDKGAEEEILSVVQNVRKPLALGYVIVKNRSQAELKAALTLEQSLVKEDEYFANHHVWQRIDPESRGSRSLCSRLLSVIVNRALDRAPYLKWGLMERLESMDTEINSLGEELPKNEAGRRKFLIKVVSRFAHTLRQICVGDYRDQLARTNSSLRIKFQVNGILQSLKDVLGLNVPDLNSDTYALKLSTGMSEMRGRELPGFGSTRLLLSTVAEELDSWRLQVEEAISQVFGAYCNTATDLAGHLMDQLPNLKEQVVETLNKVCGQQAIEISMRVDEMFLRSTESASTDQELIESINSIRFSRFDTALSEAMFVARQPGSKEDLKQHVMEVLGQSYMHFHSIGPGPNLQLEDARAALKAYWRICEKRLNEDVSSAIDMQLLQKGSEIIEQKLLSNCQEWCADASTMGLMLSEDPAVRKRREYLRETKEKINHALDSLELIVPGCEAVPSPEWAPSALVENKERDSDIAM